MNPDKILRKRESYLNKLIAFKDTESVKIITGIRRCGKSSLLKLMIEHLKENGIESEQIIEMNFESYAFRNMNADELYKYIKNKSDNNKRVYLFFDEIQRIERWEDVINAFRVDLNCDIYITGSNAYLLSSEYSTYLSGRCIEIKMLPLSFAEFIQFHDFEIKETVGLMGKPRKNVISSSGDVYTLDEIFNVYLRLGGMPGISDIGLDQEKAFVLLDGIYSSVVVRDILERENKRGRKQITDAFLLKKIILFLADNVGNNVSFSSIANTLINEGLLEEAGRKTTPSTHTIQAYVDTLLESYLFYDIKRFDIKGKEFLRTLGKYYIADIGMRNYLLGLRDRDTGHTLENVVYLELIRRGYDVAIGKMNDTEIDFIATKADKKIYIQVTESIKSEEVRKRELRPLQAIRDNYEKIILSTDNDINVSYDGINVINIVEWLTI